MVHLGDIIRKHGISFHCYANDPQLYISSCPDETYQLPKLAECIADIKNRMNSNVLKKFRKKSITILAWFYQHCIGSH